MASLTDHGGADDPRLRVVEDYRPLPESLEWVGQLAYYEARGASAFIGGEVPFAVTSGGQLARDAGAILFASLEQSARPAGPIRCLEVGPGTGLFARLLLDDLRRRCRTAGRDYYDRLILRLADTSAAMLQAIVANGVLAGHPGRFELELVDGADPPGLAGRTAELHAAFLNYVLDSLPASLVRRGENGLEQLCVRTRLSAEAPPDQRLLDEVVERARAGDPSARASLAELLPHLQTDTRYEPVDLDALPENESLHGLFPAGAGDTIVHSHAAIARLRDLAGRLSDGGFILINDFAAAAPGSERDSAYRVYGAAVAIGLNLTEIERAVSAWPEVSWHAPTGDAYDLRSRVIVRRPSDMTVSCFAERFDPERIHDRLSTMERIAELIATGEAGAAGAELDRVLGEVSWDWTLHERAAPFFAYVAKDRDRARALADAGLALNPICTGLWNVIGDCHLHGGRPGEALDCFRRTIELNPREVRGRYNASYALAAMGDQPAALAIIDDALALDAGTYRDRLLARRARLLDRLGRRSSHDA